MSGVDGGYWPGQRCGIDVAGKFVKVSSVNTTI